MPPATAYEISKVEDQAAQAELAARVVAEGLSRQETVAEVRRAAGRPTTKAKGKGTTRGRKATFRTKAGLRLTIESRKVLDNESILAAMDEVKAQIEARRHARSRPRPDDPVGTSIAGGNVSPSRG